MNDIIRPIARRDYRGAIALLESIPDPSSDETTHHKDKTVNVGSHHDVTYNSYKRQSSSIMVRIVHTMISYFSTSNIYYNELNDGEIV